MLRYGESPYLECSSRGDRRFSAFYARVNGKSIEEQYQAAKVFEDGSTGLGWHEAKGRRAVNQEECAQLFSRLWDQYIAEHPELLVVLRKASGLSDMFGQEGHVCQATELWRIREESIKSERTKLTSCGLNPKPLRPECSPLMKVFGELYAAEARDMFLALVPDRYKQESITESSTPSEKNGAEGQN